MVAETATGYNNIDIEYAKAHQIRVANVAGYSTESVVQHTFALLFYVYEKLRYYDEYVKSGEYVKSPCFTHFDKVFNELCGKTWGIAGLGSIGRRVADVAKAFGCRVVYFSASGHTYDTEFKRVSFDELLETEKQKRLNGIDALITNVPGYCICVSTADCVPICKDEKECCSSESRQRPYCK